MSLNKSHEQITYVKLMSFELFKQRQRARSRKTDMMFICNKNNKEIGLYSRVTWRSVLQSRGVTDLTAVQLCLLDTLLPLSLFPATPPPPSRLHSLPFLLYPAYTHTVTHTHTHIHLCLRAHRHLHTYTQLWL